MFEWKKKNVGVFKKNLLLVLLILSELGLMAQTTDIRDLDVYVFTNRYRAEVQRYIRNKSYFKNIAIMSPSMIDPYKRDVIDTAAIKRALIKMYPNKGASGILCLNIENAVYLNLKLYSQGSKEFNKSVAALSAMLLVIKRERPNLEIGIYGLPYKTYYDSQLIWNSNHKLDAVLKHCDILFPSLYISYPDKEKGALANKTFLEKNLRVALDYGSRLKKRVIPFVWYVVHPNNRKYGGEILTLQELKSQLGIVKNYKLMGNSVDGVVWWESSDRYFQKYVKQPRTLAQSHKIDHNDIFMQFFNKLGY